MYKETNTKLVTLHLFRVQMVPVVLRVLVAQSDSQDRWETQETPELTDHQADPEVVDQQETQDLMDSLDHR